MKKLLIAITAIASIYSMPILANNIELNTTIHLSNTCLMPFKEARSHFQEYQAEYYAAANAGMDISDKCPAHSPAALLAQIQKLQEELNRNRQYSENMIRILNNRISELEQ